MMKLGKITLFIIKRNILILSVLILLLLSGCSFFRGVGIRKQKGESEWKVTENLHPYWTIRTATPVYGIKKNDLSISLWPCPQPSFVILWGPPVASIIPNPMLFVWPFTNAKNRGDIHFFVNFKFINLSTDTLMIDMAKVNFWNKQKVLTPLNYSMLDSLSFGYIRQNRTDKLKQNDIYNFPTSSIVKINPLDSLTVTYDFREYSTEINKMTIIFDNISNGVLLPPIKLKTKARLVYQPIYVN